MVRAYLDMGEAIIDPAFAGTDLFTVLRRQETVDSTGSVVLAITYLDMLAVLAPTGKNDLTRAAAFDIQAQTIDIYTKFDLIGPASDLVGNGYKPDIIIIGGTQYIVTELNDFTRFGSGYVNAKCTSIDYVVPAAGVIQP